ncbi:MAG: hypothetical protein Ct9H300mP1_34460 [Planctomycetaceae bacterium]|nr:MAG: hypothetical protein Ct9H300mP1_34460 [Planctomycetaceae bacterium]
MNDPFVVGQAGLWAKRLLALEKLDTGGRIRRCTARRSVVHPVMTNVVLPSVSWSSRDAGFGLTDKQGPGDPRPWSDLCHVMFNAKEFIFIN